MNEPCRIIKKIEDCNKCPGYRDCVGKEFYTYQDIRWCSHQVVWIYLNSEDFSPWPNPPEHLALGIAHTGIQTEANFVKAAYVVGEVNARLNRLTKNDRDWLLSLIDMKYKQTKLIAPETNGLFNVNDFEKELPYIPKLAFHYITGWHRYGKNHEKWQNYSGWKKQKVYRNKRRAK